MIKKSNLKNRIKPNFDLIIANSKIKHSTESVVSEVRKFKERNEIEFCKIM